MEIVDFIVIKGGFMKISCLPVSLFQDMASGSMSVKEWMQMAKEVGLDAVDLSIILIKNHTTKYLNQLKTEIEDENMSITMITTYPDFSHPDKIQTERELEYLKRDIALASFLNVKYLRILAGQDYPGINRDKTIKKVIEYFKMIAPIADKFGVKLVYENHSKPGVWDYSDFSHPTLIFLEIVEGIWDTNIGINFDTANSLILGDDPVEILKKVMEKVYVIHASDALSLGELKPSVIGEGIVPFREIIRFLKEVKYDGWICIEEASNTGIDGIRKATEFIRKIWDSE